MLKCSELQIVAKPVQPDSLKSAKSKGHCNWHVTWAEGWVGSSWVLFENNNDNSAICWIWTNVEAVHCVCVAGGDSCSVTWCGVTDGKKKKEILTCFLSLGCLVDDAKTLEDDAVILRVIEAYCTSTKARQTVNSCEFLPSLLTRLLSDFLLLSVALLPSVILVC